MSCSIWGRYWKYRQLRRLFAGRLLDQPHTRTGADTTPIDVVNEQVVFVHVGLARTLA